jgi:hypothetical protein
VKPRSRQSNYRGLYWPDLSGLAHSCHPEERPRTAGRVAIPALPFVRAVIRARGETTGIHIDQPQEVQKTRGSSRRDKLRGADQAAIRQRLSPNQPMAVRFLVGSFAPRVSITIGGCDGLIEEANGSCGLSVKPSDSSEAAPAGDCPALNALTLPPDLEHLCQTQAGPSACPRILMQPHARG